MAPRPFSGPDLRGNLAAVRGRSTMGHVLVDHRWPLKAAVSGPIPECSTTDYLVIDLEATMSPRNQRHPSPEERDEKVKLDLEPDEALKLLMEMGEHPEEEPPRTPTDRD